jgi:acyl-CoA synthetase (AMP-forming)/AMP-acid ligase II
MGDRRLTYAAANLVVNQLAHAFLASGLHKGDRCAYLSKNSLDYPIVYFGASKAGVVPVPLHYRLAPPEWAFIINDSQAKLVLSSGEYPDGIDGIRDTLETVERYLAIDGDSDAGWEEYRVWIAGQSDAPPEREIGDDNAVYQMYTSGTTGHPKGAVPDHAAVTVHVMQCSHAIALSPGDRDLIVAPLYHAAAALTAFSVVFQRGTLVMHEDFIPHEIVRALSEEHIAAITLVPAMIQACLVSVPYVAERTYDTLQLLAHGASPIAEQTLRRAMEVFQCDFIQGYGLTELTCLAPALSPADHRRALESKPELLLSAGRPILGTEVRIVDEDARPLPHGALGEIVVRGPQSCAARR